MGRVISSFVYNVSCTYTRVDIVKHIQTRISGSCTGEQMEEVYKSTLFLSRILFQKHHIHSGLQRTTSLGYPPQLPHRRRYDIHLVILSFIFYFLSPFIYCINDVFLEPHVFSSLLYSFSAELFNFIRFLLIYFYFSKIGKAKSFKCNKLQNVYYNLSN